MNFKLLKKSMTIATLLLIGTILLFSRLSPSVIDKDRRRMASVSKDRSVPMNISSRRDSRRELASARAKEDKKKTLKVAERRVHSREKILVDIARLAAAFNQQSPSDFTDEPGMARLETESLATPSGADTPQPFPEEGIAAAPLEPSSQYDTNAEEPFSNQGQIAVSIPDETLKAMMKSVR